jgi:2',3'-cyclic-nucleotide 2'-phosphodiesterase (5'-nucleotidase family)
MRTLRSRYHDPLVLDAGGWAERTNPDRPDERSRILLQGLHALGLQFANVSARDLALGPAVLGSLADSTGVQLLSANVLVNGQPFFRPYAVLRRKVGNRELAIGVAGVTIDAHNATAAWPDSLDLRISDPIEAATAVLTTLEGQTDVQILLAYIPSMTLDTLTSSLSGFDLLVCGTGDLRDKLQPGPAPYVVAPGTKCKYLGWAALRLTSTGLAVAEADARALDAAIPDDPEMARRVARDKDRLAATPLATSAATPDASNGAH